MDIWNLETAPKKNQNGPLKKDEVLEMQPEALMPYIKNGSELIIPGNCPGKYKWWKDGQSVFETLLEFDAPDTVIEKYVTEGSPRKWKCWQEILKERNGNKSNTELFAGDTQ
jgi:hypothetical protein